MQMHLLSGGRLRMHRRTYEFGADREAMFELPVSCTLLRHAQGNVLFDTGCHPAVIDDAMGRWGALATRMQPIFAAEDGLLAQLGLVGLVADDIDLLVCSHLHTDHCGCNGFFNRATMLCHSAELAIARAEADQDSGYYAADWDHGMTETIDGARDLFGDGGITLLPMPGHTPGMLIAHVVLGEQAFVLASDAAPLQINLETRFAPRNSWDSDLTVTALDEISRLQSGGATILFGHDDAQWQQLRHGAHGYGDGFEQ